MCSASYSSIFSSCQKCKIIFGFPQMCALWEVPAPVAGRASSLNYTACAFGWSKYHCWAGGLALKMCLWGRGFSVVIKKEVGFVAQLRTCFWWPKERVTFGLPAQVGRRDAEQRSRPRSGCLVGWGWKEWKTFFVPLAHSVR